MVKTLFLTAGDETWGSSRLRCFWPAKHMDNAQVVTIPDGGRGSVDVDGDFEVFIYQKYGNPDLQKNLRKNGVKVYLDQCDPMWWFSDQTLMRAIFENADGAAFSTEALRKDFLKWWGEDYNTITIPDRLDFDFIDKKKKHHWIKPVRFLWHGVAVNRVTLNAVWANLSRLRVNGYEISLTIFDDQPDLPIREVNDIMIMHAKWELDKWIPQIAAHDISLLPPYPGPWGKVKSNNKAITASACNVPYTDGTDYDELVMLMDHKNRQAVAQAQSEGIEEYDVKLSAAQWEAFIA